MCVLILPLLQAVEREREREVETARQRETERAQVCMLLLCVCMHLLCTEEGNREAGGMHALALNLIYY